MIFFVEKMREAFASDIFGSPGLSPGRAIELPQALASALESAAALALANVKVFMLKFFM